ncbi:potassium transporter Trk [Schumannella luteola]|nr:potassium transporter Trk [Schumannella luteola]
MPTDVQQVSIRRAPKFGVFIALGAVLGALVTLILTSLYPADPNIGFTASYAYFLVYGIPAGVVLGGLVGLAFDRRSRRRARTVEAQHQRVD